MAVLLLKATELGSLLHHLVNKKLYPCTPHKSEFYSKQSLPKALPSPKKDSLYKDKKLIFRKTTDHTRVNIFQGGHEIITHAALNWLKEQRKTHKAQWSIKKIITLKNHNKAQQSGL